MKLKHLIASCGLVLASSLASAQSLISAGDLQVSAEEFALAIEHILPAGQQENMRTDPKNPINFLSDYFVFKQMAQAAERKGLDKSPALQIQLDYHRAQLLTQALMEEYLAGVKIPNLTALAQEAYLVDKKSFSYPAQVHAAHILIAVNAAQDDTAAKAKADKIYAQVQKDSKRFAELAKASSDDPSAQDNSGDLGFFTRDAMVEPFADAAFSMKKGQISKPIKTNFGYHIIQVLDTKPAGVQSFAEVKDELIAEQERKFIAAKRVEFVDTFRAHPDLKLNEEAMTEFIQQLK